MRTEEIDWKSKLREFRSAYLEGDFLRGSIESKYQSDLKSHNQFLEELQFFVAPTREDAESCNNVFEALARFGSIGAPIPPELIETICYLYEDVYLENEGKVSLEKTFFNQPGKHVFAKKMKERRDNFDAAMIRTAEILEGKSRIEAASEIADEREKLTGKDIDPESILRVLRRKKLLD